MNIEKQIESFFEQENTQVSGTIRAMEYSDGEFRVREFTPTPFLEKLLLPI